MRARERDGSSGALAACVCAALSALAWLVARVPFRRLSLFGAVLGGLAGGVLRIRRAHVTAAMARAGIGVPGATATAMYRALGTSVFELLWLAGRRPGSAESVAYVVPASRDALSHVLASGRGVVFAASHTGNWDLTACAAVGWGELLVVTKRLSVGAIDAFWQTTRARAGIRLVEAKGAVAVARAVLRRGGSVAMMIDQVPDTKSHAVRAPFLGADAWVDRAPAILAAHVGAPLVVCASRRDACGLHAIEVLAVFEPPPRATGRTEGRQAASARAAWATHVTCEATRALDGFVRAHPSEWLWMHRRWRAPGLSPRARVAMPLPCTTPSSSPAAASRVASS